MDENAKKHATVFTNLINKIETHSLNFDELDDESKAGLIDDLLLAIELGFLEDDSPLLKMTIRRLNSLLKSYKLDLTQYNALKNIILSIIRKKSTLDFMLIMDFYSLECLNKIDHFVIINDLKLIICLALKNGSLKEAEFAEKQLILFVRKILKQSEIETDTFYTEFLKVKIGILSMAARTNNKDFFINSLNRIYALFKDFDKRKYNMGIFAQFISNAVFFCADKNWAGVINIINKILKLYSWKDILITKYSDRIVYEWLQAISLLIVRKWHDLQKEFVDNLVKFLFICNKKTQSTGNTLIINIIKLQITKDGEVKAMDCFYKFFIWIFMKYDYSLKQSKNNFTKLSCSSNENIQLIYGLLMFIVQNNFKYTEHIVFNKWYDYWAEKLKNNNTLFLRVDSLTKVVVFYWLLFAKKDYKNQMIYLTKILIPNQNNKKYSYLVYDRSGVEI